jgi:hypothetical protein
MAFMPGAMIGVAPNFSKLGNGSPKYWTPSQKAGRVNVLITDNPLFTALNLTHSTAVNFLSWNKYFQVRSGSALCYFLEYCQNCEQTSFGQYDFIPFKGVLI